MKFDLVTPSKQLLIFQLLNLKYGFIYRHLLLLVLYAP
jgi:hypothetical protein